MLCIYDKKTTKGNFENNGLAVLDETISCFINEEINGDYSLELEYPSNSIKAKYLQEWNIIKAEEQLFRIYKVQKQSADTKTINVWAKHIFYDISYYFLEEAEGENCSLKTALTKILPSDLSAIYNLDSDIIIGNSFHFIEKNPAEAVFSLIDIWGIGELKRDNYNIKILKQMGKDSEVLISQGKNISGIKFNADTSNVVTKLYPVGKDGIRLTEKYINVPNWDSSQYPSFPIIKKVEFTEASDEVTLRAMAKERANTIGLSRVNIEVDFIELSMTKEYENYKHLEKVNVGDLVIVRHKDFGIDMKFPVIKIKRDILSGINVKVELGEPKDNILSQLDTGKLKTTVDELENKVAGSLTSVLYYANPVALTIGTSPVQPIYVGITATTSTNLFMNFSIYCTSSMVSTLTIQIQLDGKDIPFMPKQKLQQGDNTIGIPICIPQVSKGVHYSGIFLKVDAGTVVIPIFNLQCTFDGRNLLGGLSAEPPHAECMESVKMINLYSLFKGRFRNSNYLICLELPITTITSEQVSYNINIFAKKNISTSCNISFK